MIDWQSPLATIASDTSSIALAIRVKVMTTGGAYDRAGRPDVLGTPSEQEAQRALLRSQLTTLDRAAASVDGLPLTPISMADPGASTAAIVARVKTAAAVASGPTRALLSDMATAAEPQLQYGAAFYVHSPPTHPKTVGEIQLALVDALAELAAYRSFAG